MKKSFHYPFGRMAVLAAMICLLLLLQAPFLALAEDNDADDLAEDPDSGDSNSQDEPPPPSQDFSEDEPLNVCTSKRLVVLAGPRRTATTSVAEFFYKWARGGQGGRKGGKLYHPLKKFRWPLVYGTETNATFVERPYKRFNLLVTEPDNVPLRTEIIDAIKRDWNINAVTAVIFGGEEFDQVGGSALSEGENAIRAVQDVAEAVGAEPECVTILLNYRVPRFQHWVSLYSSKSLIESGSKDEQEEDETPNEFLPYEQHMCLDESHKERISELGTSMNPFYLAETYLEADERWNVKMIDMGGVEASGSDISHTVGCDILGGVCNKEGLWVKGHVDETITNKVLQNDYENLPESEIVHSEQIFRYRDCAYELDFSARYRGRFDISNYQSIWEDCDHEDEKMEQIYQSLRSPETGTPLVYDALLSQVDCSEYGKSSAVPSFLIEEILNGDHLTEMEENLALGKAGASSFGMVGFLAVVVLAVGGFRLWKRSQNGTSGGGSGGRSSRIEMKGVGSGLGGGLVPNTFRDRFMNSYNIPVDDDSSSDDESSSGDSNDFI